MKILLTLGIITALVVLWVMVVRQWLRKQDWAWSKAFFAWIEPLETALWKKSETIFFARFKMLIGLLLTAMTQIGAIDITPLMPFVPDEWEGAFRVVWNMIPLTITLLGWIDEQLRKDVTTPLEVVAAPEAVKAALPEVQKMETAKAEAVEAVKEAKAEGGA